jgi:hypothetical protein
MPWRDKDLLTFLTSNTTWKCYCKVFRKTIFKTVSCSGTIVSQVHSFTRTVFRRRQQPLVYQYANFVFTGPFWELNCHTMYSSCSINQSFQTYKFKLKLTTHQCSPDASWTPVTMSLPLISHFNSIMEWAHHHAPYHLFLSFPEGILPHILPQSILLGKQLSAICYRWSVPHYLFIVSAYFK